MKRKIIMAIVIFSLGINLVGCNYNDTIVLENIKIDKINKPLIEFSINTVNDVGSEMVNVGYHRGSVYISKYVPTYGNPRYYLGEELYILNSDRSVKESELKIPSKYIEDFNSTTNTDYLFSQTDMFDWRTSTEKEIITSQMIEELTIEQLNNGRVDKDLNFLVGNQSYARLIWTNSTEQQIIIVNMDTGEYFTSEIIHYDKEDKIVSVFYNESDDSINYIKKDGTIYGFNKKVGENKSYFYDKIDLNDNHVIKNNVVCDGNIYFEIGIDVEINTSGTHGNVKTNSKQNSIVRYDYLNKETAEVFKNTSDSNIKLVNSNDGYVVLGTKKEFNGPLDSGFSKGKECYNYYLAKLKNDEVNVIRAIAEDSENEILDPNVYINELEKVVLVASNVNNGVIIKYQVYGLD